MSTSETPVKVNIGFHGGQQFAARVKPAELSKLRDALGKTGWHELAGESGTAYFDLTKIDYLLIDDDSQRIGF